MNLSASEGSEVAVIQQDSGRYLIRYLPSLTPNLERKSTYGAQ